MYTKSLKTRIWWDGSEVVFIGWTEKALIFAWNSGAGAPVHMPRGSVIRLLEKGVLRVEGRVPYWLQPYAFQRADAPPPKPETGRLTAITRLIRKLSGGEREANRYAH